MNHLFSNKIIALAIMFFTLFSLQSCNRDDEPVAPINETKDKGHDEWGKVEIILYEGHLHGKEFHANPMYINGKVLPKKQILTITRDENGNLVRVRKNVLVEGEKDNYKEVEVLKDSDHPFETQTTVDEQGNSLNGARYAMEIVYYNKKGERMNHEFVTPEMRPIHQHFFTTKSYSDLFTGAKIQESNQFITDLYEYTYRDTAPENKMYKKEGAKVLDDPLGLKGYFFFKKYGVKFNMELRLSHLYTSKYDSNGQTSPANNPSLRILTTGTTDLLIEVPFVVIGNNDGESQWFKDLSQYYNISEEDAENEFYLDATGDAESGGYWM